MIVRNLLGLLEDLAGFMVHVYLIGIMISCGIWPKNHRFEA